MKKDLLQLWVRGDKAYGKRVNDKADSLGFITADYLRKLIDYGLNHNDPYFFTKGDDFCPQKTTNKHK